MPPCPAPPWLFEMIIWPTENLSFYFRHHAYITWTAPNNVSFESALYLAYHLLNFPWSLSFYYSYHTIYLISLPQHSEHAEWNSHMCIDTLFFLVTFFTKFSVFFEICNYSLLPLGNLSKSWVSFHTFLSDLRDSRDSLIIFFKKRGHMDVLLLTLTHLCKE